MRHDTPHIFGYTDRFSARPGETLTFHISGENVLEYDAALVRLHHGFTGSAGPGFQETPVPSEFDGRHPAEWHVCTPGSFVEVPDPLGLLRGREGFRLRAAVFATLPGDSRSSTLGAYHVTQNSMAAGGSRQTVMGTWDDETRTGFALTLENGVPTVIWNEDGEMKQLCVEGQLVECQWYDLEATYLPDDGLVTLSCVPATGLMNRLS
jgi:N,N-dimethylformamidase